MWRSIHGTTHLCSSTVFSFFVCLFKYSWFTVLYSFQVYNKLIYLYMFFIYIYSCILFFFRFFSIVGYYKILNIVPCAIQYDLVVYLFYTAYCVSANLKLLIYLSSRICILKCNFSRLKKKFKKIKSFKNGNVSFSFIC